AGRCAHAPEYTHWSEAQANYRGGIGRWPDCGVAGGIPSEHKGHVVLFGEGCEASLPGAVGVRNTCAPDCQRHKQAQVDGRAGVAGYDHTCGRCRRGRLLRLAALTTPTKERVLAC